MLWMLLNWQRRARYRKKPVLTGGDLEFFYRLRRALPECLVCPQVAASALIEPIGIGKARQVAADLIAEKKVGYAIFDEELKLIAVVELSHRSRLTRREAARDGWFTDAGIRLIRFHSRHLPSEAKIHATIFARPDVRVEPHAAWDSDQSRDSIEFRRPPMPLHETAKAH